MDDYEVVLDLEGNGLLKEVTRMHIIGFRNKATGEIKKWLEGDLGWKEEFEKVTRFIGHNLMGYDFPALEKLFGYRPRADQKIHDTMIMSLVLDYNRFAHGRHGLESWGNYLGSPKIEFDDFKEYSEEMEEYWLQDLNLTDTVHNVLLEDYYKLIEKDTNIGVYLKAENAVSRWCALAELHGWPFDREAGKALLAEMEVQMNIARDKILPRLGTKVIAVDKRLGEVEFKEPKWIKIGAYAAHTANWFGIDPYTGQDMDRLVEGPYSRIEFADLDLDSVTDVKVFLFRNGWEPTEWNFKSVPNPDKPGRFIREKTSPKITEDSLECMDGDGKLYCDFLTTKSRHSILKGWLENCDDEGNLHGSCFPIGTPSMRARHSIIVNVPAADSPWGKQMRSLFRCKPGWKLVGCDSSGNQARGLAHYLGSPEYTEILLTKDIHQYNADLATEVLLDMGIEIKIKDPKTGEFLDKVPRPRAKRILYAFLFGASGAKLWSYIFDVLNDKLGKQFKVGFTKGTPGLEELLKKLENIFGKTRTFGDGYIPGIAGNRIYCDSFHKLLVYLLQACEKATCSAAVMLTMERLEEAGIPYQPLIMMHDEEDFMVPEEFAEQAAAIGKQAFKDGPNLFGITIMDGEAKIGDNWYEVH